MKRFDWTSFLAGVAAALMLLAVLVYVGVL
jgi:hypothetical protein